MVSVLEISILVYIAAIDTLVLRELVRARKQQERKDAMS